MNSDDECEYNNRTGTPMNEKLVQLLNEDNNKIRKVQATSEIDTVQVALQLQEKNHGNEENYEGQMKTMVLYVNLSHDPTI